jgi:hypothetical protein
MILLDQQHEGKSERRITRRKIMDQGTEREETGFGEREEEVVVQFMGGGRKW